MSFPGQDIIHLGRGATRLKSNKVAIPFLKKGVADDKIIGYREFKNSRIAWDFAFFNRE